LTPAVAEARLKNLVLTGDSFQVPDQDKAAYRGFRNPTLWWIIITVLVLYFYVRYF